MKDYLYQSKDTDSGVTALIEYSTNTILLENVRVNERSTPAHRINFSDIVYLERFDDAETPKLVLTTTNGTITLEKGMERSEELHRQLALLARKSPNRRNPSFKEWIIPISVGILAFIITSILATTKQ